MWPILPFTYFVYIEKTKILWPFATNFIFTNISFAMKNWLQIPIFVIDLATNFAFTHFLFHLKNVSKSIANIGICNRFCLYTYFLCLEKSIINSNICDWFCNRLFSPIKLHWPLKINHKISKLKFVTNFVTQNFPLLSYIDCKI